MTVEEKRAAHLSYLNTVMPDLLGRLSWTRPEIEAFQTQALREMLRHVRSRSPWHAERTRDIDIETITPADLDRLPVMSKPDLMENWDRIVTIPGATRREAETALQAMTDQFYIWGDHVLLASGGSSGRPGIFVYDWHAMALLYGGLARGFHGALSGLARDGLRVLQEVRMASIAAEPSAHGSYVVNRIFASPRNPVHQLSGWRSTGDLIGKLNDIQPHFVFCYPTAIQELAAATRSGALAIAPRVIYLGSEHLPDAVRDLARATWPGADILTCWGTSEGGGSFPCPCGDGFHISEDQVIIEAVDKNGRPVRPGQLSSGIYFTNLFNKALPIIRYYIDDVFELTEGPCACGSAYTKVRQVHGRTLDTFHYGATVILPVVLELAVLEQPDIFEYQIRQTRRGAHLAYRAKSEIDRDRLQSKMRKALVSHGLDNPEITVEPVTVLKRTAAGKLRRFVPLGDESTSAKP